MEETVTIEQRQEQEQLIQKHLKKYALLGRS